MLRFVEEIILLMLNDDDGRFVSVPSWSLDYAISGAVLMELALGESYRQPIWKVWFS